jgi:XRE family transcriptional regulator, master regulator for biofilm formation
MTLGERVERLRRERRLSQVDLSQHAHISQGLLSRIERGQTPNPGADALKGLARALGCSIDYLVGLYDEDPSLAAVGK